MGHDVVVVGSGAAGSVLAARLSENPDRRVLLVEAGRDFASAEATPADLLDGREACFNPAYDWNYTSEPDGSGRAVQLYRARVIGGCSAVNAAMALRGAPGDYDVWAAAGNPGWSFSEVLPFFTAAERDEDFDDDWHGRSGPLPIRRATSAELTPLQRAFLEAARGLGYPEVADHNRPGAVGVGLAPRNLHGDTRMSTALTYLAQARARSNLEVRAGCLADRVRVRSGRAEGVVLAGGETLDAGLVVLAAGSYGSPAILMRSGVGPGEHLRSLGIQVECDLPGVGQGLADHPLWGLDQPYRGRVTPGHRYNAILTMRSSRWEREGWPDLHIWAAGPFEAPDSGSPTGAVFALVFSVVKPFSRGWLRLRSADPVAPPGIEPGYLRDPRDLQRALELVREARRLCRERPLTDLIAGPELAPGPDAQDDAALEAALRSRVETYHHPVGTCRMGPDPAGGAVVDARGRVHGVEDLVVADASIMPEVPAANTNLPTIMVAERISAWLQARPSPPRDRSGERRGGSKALQP